MRHVRLLALASTLLLGPAAAAAQEAACSLLASSYADAILNPPKGEDTDFFISTGGVPNVMFLLDTSGSMRRLPPDGASDGWGSFEDPVTRFGCANAYANTRTFNSSCGITTVEGQPYSATTDWAAATDASGRYCGYLDQAGKPMKTDKRGFDPDYYLDGSGTPKFFAAARVYRDRDGWTDTSLSPQAEASVAAFCSRASWSAAQRASCQTCMDTRGYWFDGTYVGTGGWGGTGRPCGSTAADCAPHSDGTCIKDSTGLEWNGVKDGTAHCKTPNVYMSGNFLNFYPPKFLIARKVMKDILASVKLFRLGLATFDSSSGAKIVEPLNPPCNQFGSRSAFYNNRNSIKATINNSTKVSFSTWTPLAEALLDVGHYYATQSLPWFAGTTYDRVALEEKSANNRSVCFACQKSSIILISDGLPTEDGSTPGVSGWSPTTQVIADTPGNYAGKTGYNITTIPATDCPMCETAAEAPDTALGAGNCTGGQSSGACDNSANAVTAWLPRVAWYLHNMDARLDTEKGVDGYAMTKKQVLDIYTIGLGTIGNASLILRHTAEVGGGLYNGGSGDDTVVSASDLKRAIEAALQDVNTRSLAFGSASVSTLQAAASQGVLVPRFEPSKKAHWNGHLYAFDLWSEFTAGCSIPASGASGPANGDFDCDGKCTSVFLRDRNSDPSKPGDFISEDVTGAFVKNSPRDRATCGFGNKCTDCATPSTVAAVPFWDAGDRLSPLEPDGTPKATKNYKDWNERRIYTVVDDAAPLRRFTSADSLVQFADDDTTVTKLLPYLNIVGNREFCSNVADQLVSLGNPRGAIIRTQLVGVPPTYLECGRAVVQYVMGADVFNERTCSSYPGSYCTRPYQLGDVFHSSPIEVWPPLASDGLLCQRGMHPQCLRSLFSGSIPNPSTAGHASAYDDYQKSATYKHRNKFHLVGANDGMVHAILTGRWHAGNDDPRTPQREDLDPYEGYHDVGTGEEIWGFVPPDLLGKMPLFLGGTHQYYVDGTPMVRDVWIDGWLPNRLGGATSANGIREGNEFHTVAIVGERRGGNHYVALDVTDAGDDLDAKPRFMWLFPQPDDPAQLQFGETYAEFNPTPPPIGPVRIDSGTPPCANTNHRVIPASTGDRCFEERWIVFLSGGFDPLNTKGRGVHMVDIGTGEQLLDFSQPKGAASGCDASKDPRCHLNYSVAAPVGMMMWGTQASVLDGSDSMDGYFDTATFGDTGGQLWAIRFRDPGQIDSTTGRVKNWYGGRILQMNKAGSPASGVDYCGSQPFFHITANLPLKSTGLYRVLAGTGDRFNLLDHAGGICSPDNLRACLAKGCTVKIDDGAGGPGAVYGVEDLLGTQGYGMSHNGYCGAFDPSTYTSSSSGGGGASCSSITAKVDRVEITCPAALTCTGVDEITQKALSISCAGGHCTEGTLVDQGSPLDLKAAADNRNWFFSVRVFDGAGDRQIFSTLAGAIAYDAARFGEADLVSINEYDASPTTKPLATDDGKGWKYYFDHGTPTLPESITFDGAAHHIWRADERVASTSAVQASCTFWNTLQVALPEDALDPLNVCPVASPCKAGKKQVTYLYGARPGSGELCLFVDGVTSRSQRTESIVPPHIGKLVAYVASGQVSFGLTSVRIPQGGTNISLGDAKDIVSIVEWVPIDKDLEKCRHSPKGSPPPECR